MKNLLLTLITFFIGFNGFSQIVISGQIKNVPDSAEIEITYYNNSFEYIKVSMGTVKPDKQGNFKLKYLLDNPTTARFTIAEQQTDLYLIPGDSLYMTLDYKNFDSTLHYTGKGAADNNYMAADVLANFNWQAQLHREFDYADKFAAFEDSLERENQAFLRAHDSPEFSPQFRKYILAETKYRFIYPRYMFTISFNPETNTIDERPVPANYFDFLKNMNPDDQQNAENGRYQWALGTYLYMLHEKEMEIPETLPEPEKTKMRITKGYDLRKRLFKDQVLDYQLTEFMKYNIGKAIADIKFADALMKDYKATCKNATYIAIIDKIYILATTLAPGQPAPTFTLTDTEGKQVALSSFKGKVVYIDFWATWCAPCIAQMPHSHELMEKFKDEKNIAFLYVNVKDNVEEWKKYVKSKNMQGVNLFANTEQSAYLYKAYNFSGIPHFVLIDKNGNLINANADDPGNAETAIRQALK